VKPISRAAKQFPKDIAVSGWYGLLPPPEPPRVLDEDLKADWVVVGAGFAGLFAARKLRVLHPSDRIVVLDAQRVGFGAAGRNSGFMIDLPHELNSESYAGGQDKARIKLNRQGIAEAKAAADEAELNQYFNPCGKYHGAAGAQGLASLREFEKHLSSLGEDFKSLDAQTMFDVTGSRHFIGGTFTPGAVIIQPAAYIRGLAKHLARHVDVFENSPVAAIDFDSGLTVRTKNHRISAGRIIFANNGHLESFGFFPKQLMHIFTFASMTRQLTLDEQKQLGGYEEWGLIPADPMGSTLRRIKQGRIVVRNTFTYNPSMTTSEPQIARIGAKHDSSFAARFPNLKNIEMEYRWGGHLCLSMNSAPAFGEIEKNVFAVGCCNGLGTVRGALCGTAMAEFASGTPSPTSQEIMDEGKPTKLYPEPLQTLGANAKLWWMQKRAGKDL
jgi:glycine/D-amino acid oxidase-like deaminating enzyme